MVTAPFGWNFPYAWSRKPILAANVVCTSQPLAAQAGLRMLAEGGTAVDAAIATAITLTLVEPVSNGIGSDAFAIVWDGRQLHGLERIWPLACGMGTRVLRRQRRSGARLEFGYGAGSGVGMGRAALPSSANCRSTGSSNQRSPTAATAFWCRRRSRSNGRRRSPLFEAQPGFAEAFLPGGRAPKPGELFRFPDHAATLEQIAATGGEAFYRGELASKLEGHSAANGGAMRASDLAAHRADWVGTIGGTYRGYTIHEIPPNGQGIVALIALGILEQFDMSSLPVDSAESVHLQIEALKLAFADAQAYVADIDHMRMRPERLLDREYLKQRATLIDRKRAKPASAGTPNGGTVYLTAADASGVMVSMIQSNYMGFGSGVVVPGTGISLQNRGADFAAAQGHPNQVGPSKRPYHTIIPGFVTKDGAPVMSFGVMGGTMQPQGHVQVLARIADHDQNPQTACDGPRFRWVDGTQVSCEQGFPPATRRRAAPPRSRPYRGRRLQPVRQLPGDLAARWRLCSGERSAPRWASRSVLDFAATFCDLVCIKVRKHERTLAWTRLVAGSRRQLASAEVGNQIHLLHSRVSARSGRRRAPTDGFPRTRGVGDRRLLD